MIKLTHDKQADKFGLFTEQASVELSRIDAIALAKLLSEFGIVADFTSGELTATKRHLDDMRRLVLMENKDGDV